MSDSSPITKTGFYSFMVFVALIALTVGIAVGIHQYDTIDCQYGTIKTMVKENDNYRIVCAAPSPSVCPPADSILVGQTKKFKNGFQELAQICYEDRDKWQTALDQCRAERDIVSKMCCDQLEAYQKDASMTSTDMTTRLLTIVLGDGDRVQSIIRIWRESGYTEDEIESMAYALWMMSFNSIYGKFGMRDS